MAEDKKAMTENPKAKRTRIPITGRRLILEVRGKEPGYHYSWIPEDMVYVRQQSGFEHVRHPVEVGTERIDVSRMPTDSYVTRNVGGGKIAYLMRIPQEFYDQDMAEEQELVNEHERARIRENLTDGLSGTIRVKT